MSLQDPTKKMSKSDSNPNAYISLLDPKDVVIKKFKKAVTDSMNVVRYSDEQPGVQNLINIYACITQKTIKEIERKFENVGYGTFKVAVGEAVANTLSKIQEKYAELNSPENEKILKEVYEEGANRARVQAKLKLRQVYDAIGFVLK